MDLTAEIKQEIKKHALENVNVECCGLVLNNGSVIKKINKSKYPEFHFIIEEDLSDTLFVYHSHPKGGGFSEQDLMISDKLAVNFIVYDIVNDDFYVHITDTNRKIPYLGRPFLLGAFDCLTLVIEYFQRELNIPVKNIDHEFRLSVKYWKECSLNYSDSNLMLNHFKQNGFKEVNGRIQKNDVIIVKNGPFKTPLHCGVYIGDNKVLHQPIIGLSEVTGIETFRDRIWHTVRHKKL